MASGGEAGEEVTREFPTGEGVWVVPTTVQCESQAVLQDEVSVADAENGKSEIG